MTLGQINRLWEEYKSKYDLDMNVKIHEVRYDAEDMVEGFFNLIELFNGEFTLHLNPRMHLYTDNYARFILFHEFTHFYDFLKRPYDDPESTIIWMNAYSEYHACRVTLARFIEMFNLKSLHLDKVQIPGPFEEITLRRLLVENVYRSKICIQKFFTAYHIDDFGNGFRQLMYLFGYLSLFEQDKKMVVGCLKAINLDYPVFYALYDALKDMDFDKVVECYKSIAESAMLIYLRAAFREFYDQEILPDEELNKINTENYKEYIEILDQRLAERNKKAEEN